LELKDNQVDFAVFPELCITGYGCEDMFHNNEMIQEACDSLLRVILPHTKNITAIIGIPLPYRGSLFNAAVVISNMKVLGATCKRNLCVDGIHYESRWFKAWPYDKVGKIKIEMNYEASKEYEFSSFEFPVGDLYYSINGITMVVEICEDAWSSQRPLSMMAKKAPDLCVNPSASHFSFGKRSVREGFVLEGSRAYNCAYVYANLLGNESGRIIFDGDSIIAMDGKLMAKNERFSFKEYEVTSITLNIDLARKTRQQLASFTPEIEVEDEQRIAFEHKRTSDKWRFVEDSIVPPLESFENSSDLKFEEFTRAVSLALFDYMYKSRQDGFIISLSGGADSTACAILVSEMLRLSKSSQGLHDVLTCVYQATRNSGSVTENAARTVAESIGAKFYNIDVDSTVESYKETIRQALEIEEWSWKEHDIALQNIQARVRAPSVWMLANLERKLLLATSNRSEAAVGYCTMDGDTCGGLSPIAGIDKTFLREWLVWMEKDYPCLSVVNDLVPTAELRPQEQMQKDEDDLMPYHILNDIERMFIAEKMGLKDIWLNLKRKNYSHEYEEEKLFSFLEKFFKLWVPAQWKRERYAPSFHLDDHNLDPKTGCRFPIISAGFYNQLSRLKNDVFGNELVKQRGLEFFSK